MRRHLRGWTVVVGVGMIGGLLLWRHSRRDMTRYTPFTSQHLHAQFEYPSGWTVHEIAKGLGRLLGEVQIFGPRREDLRYSLYLDVAAEPMPSSPTGSALSLQEAVERAIATQRKLPSYHVLARQPARCHGAPAVRVVASYALHLPLEGVEAKPVEFREVAAYCQRGSQLFRLTYAAPADTFEQHEHAFERLVKSLRFLP